MTSVIYLLQAVLAYSGYNTRRKDLKGNRRLFVCAIPMRHNLGD